MTERKTPLDLILKWRVTYRIGVHSGALSRAKHAQRSTMSKKIRLPMHPRNFCSHMTIGSPARPPIRPQHRHANVKKLKQQVWQPKCNSRFYLTGKRMAARTFREKKQQQSRVFFDIIFDVYTHVGNRERVRASVCKQRRRISLQQKHVIAAVRK